MGVTCLQFTTAILKQHEVKQVLTSKCDSLFKPTIQEISAPIWTIQSSMNKYEASFPKNEIYKLLVIITTGGTLNQSLGAQQGRQSTFLLEQGSPLAIFAV